MSAEIRIGVGFMSRGGRPIGRAVAAGVALGKKTVPFSVDVINGTDYINGIVYGDKPMTRTEAAANYANVYRAHAIAKGRTCNIEVATAYATSDILNMTKNMSEADAVYLINDDAAFMMEAA